MFLDGMKLIDATCFILLTAAFQFCSVPFQVFSFLDHVNLCRAAIVCKQWRAGSSHEDFWKCLNFQDRNISEEQCEFYFYLWKLVLNLELKISFSSHSFPCFHLW